MVAGRKTKAYIRKQQSLKPRRLERQTSVVKRADKSERGVNLRQFVAEEISTRRELAHVKQSLLAIRSRAQRVGGHPRLPEPHPANEDVPERVEIDRCVRKSKCEVVAGEDSLGRRAQLIKRLLERRGFRAELGLKAPERDSVLNLDRKSVV